MFDVCYEIKSPPGHFLSSCMHLAVRTSMSVSSGVTSSTDSKLEYLRTSIARERKAMVAANKAQILGGGFNCVTAGKVGRRILV
jgi:hypothetical protein